MQRILQARYNLAVYDLDQVSRQISEIMLDLSEDNAYEELAEPSFSRFDAVMADAQAGLADANDAFGGGEEHNKDWEQATQEAKMNLLPKWKRQQEEFKAMAKGEQERLSHRMSGPNEEPPREKAGGTMELPIEKIIGDPNPVMDPNNVPGVHVDIEAARPAPHAEREKHTHSGWGVKFREAAKDDVPVVCVGKSAQRCRCFPTFFIFLSPPPPPSYPAISQRGPLRCIQRVVSILAPHLPRPFYLLGTRNIQHLSAHTTAAACLVSL
jgi:hypothetical protein